MKIFLTGEKGVGKSTCINEIIKECVLSVSGFQTLPFYEYGVRTGFYMHALGKRDINDVRFSIQHATWNEAIPRVFDTFGVQVLKESMLLHDSFLIMDEIGYLEKEEREYLKMLFHVLDNFHNIIGVLKKCDIQYIQEIKARKDIILLDFDKLYYDNVKQMLKEYVEGKR